MLKALRTHAQLFHQQDQGLTALREKLRGVSGRYETLCTIVNQQFQNLTGAVQDLTVSATPAAETTPAETVRRRDLVSPAVPTVFPDLSRLGRFNGEPGDC